jgi:hypothetical protein
MEHSPWLMTEQPMNAPVFGLAPIQYFLELWLVKTLRPGHLTDGNGQRLDSQIGEARAMHEATQL